MGDWLEAAKNHSRTIEEHIAKLRHAQDVTGYVHVATSRSPGPRGRRDIETHFLERAWLADIDLPLVGLTQHSMHHAALAVLKFLG